MRVGDDGGCSRARRQNVKSKSDGIFTPRDWVGVVKMAKLTKFQAIFLLQSSYVTPFRLPCCLIATGTNGKIRPEQGT
jgi:hypothetical protein